MIVGVVMTLRSKTWKPHKRSRFFPSKVARTMPPNVLSEQIAPPMVADGWAHKLFESPCERVWQEIDVDETFVRHSNLGLVCSGLLLFQNLTIVSPQGSPRVTMVTFSCNQSRSISSLGAKYSEIEPKADFYWKVKIPWFKTWYIGKCFYEIVSTLMVRLKRPLHLQCNRFEMIKHDIECQMAFIQQITVHKNQSKHR